MRVTESNTRHCARRWWTIGALVCLAALPFSFLSKGVEAPESAAAGVEIIVVNTLPEAQEALRRLKSGEDFAALARTLSTDPTANQGGYIGELDPSGLRLELRNALAAVAPGELTEVTKIPSGFAILKTVVKRDGPPVTSPARSLPLAGAGAVRLSPDIGGFTQANVAMAVTMPKTPGWGQDLRAVCDARQQAIPLVLGKIEALFTQKEIDPEKAIFARFTAGELWAYKGEIDNAIVEWEAAYRTAGESGKMAPQLEEALGVAYLYRASQDQPEAKTIDESWLFPTHPGAVKPRTADVDRAEGYLLKCLKREPSNLEVEWLLSLCYMSDGKYPSEYPGKHLLTPERVKSQEAAQRFVDIAPAAGLNIPTTAGSVIVDDFDNDGLLDVVTSQQDDCAPLHYLHNEGNGKFANRSAEAGLSDQLGGLNIIQADYNNDGCMDILVLRGGWEFSRRMSLLRNSCRGGFTDITAQSGLAEPARSTQSAVWTDINNDGNLDLFIVNENAPAELFLNRGDGTFANISEKAGVNKTAFSKAVVAGDYDNDGFPDLYVSNLNGYNFLYHNNGDSTFTEVAESAGVQMPWASFAAWFFDYDNDGLPDLFVTSYYMSTEETARNYLGLPVNAETLKLYKNLGNGKFSDVTVQVGLNRVFMPMGSNFGDMDNDGYLDIYLGNGNPSFASLVPNVLLRNKGGKSFVEVTTATGTGAMSKGHGVAFADLDNDGDQDIFVVMGGAVPGDRRRARLFENPGNGNNWLNLQLVGSKSNRGAVGARINVTIVEKDGSRRTLYRTVGSGGSFGASPLQQNFGLGSSTRIESVEITWPASNTKQTFSDVQPNQFLRIKEFETTYSKLRRPVLHLGGAKRPSGPS